jgi:VanZ family protein
MRAKHTLFWFIAALVFWLLNVTLHLEFSNWIVVSYATAFGDFVPLDHTHAIAVIVCLLMAAFLFLQWRHGNNRVMTLGGWVAAFAAMVASMFLITTTVVEMIHFLQYGLLAWMLALAFDRDRTRWPLLTLMFLTTWLGILDELNQYFYLTQNNSTYIDFNDFVLNQVGACAGLLAYYGFRVAPVIRPRWSTLQTMTASGYALLALVTLLLGVSGHLQYTPEQTVPPGGIDTIEGSLVIFFQREPGLLSNFQPTFSTGRYYVMGALEGFLVMLLITGLLQAFYLGSRQETAQF